MTRILFIGDLAATGFGTVTTDLGRALIERGEDVRFLSQNAFDLLPEPFNSRTVDVTTFTVAREGVTDIHTEAIKGLFRGSSTAFLTDGHPWGEWKPEAIIILGDFATARVIMEPLLEELKAAQTVLHYVPIEGVGLPPRWAETWKIARPVAMCEFGANEIEKVTGEKPPVAYHGVDAVTFRPVSKKRPMILSSPDQKPNFLASRDECKQAWVGYLAEQNDLTRVPKNWLLRTDRHMPRKNYPALIRSLAPVLSRHPDWALVLHCQPWDQGGDLYDARSKLPPLIQKQLLLTNTTGLSRDLLVTLYNAADIYVSNSAEGFGLTIAEALSCGVPAVGVRYSAVPEVIGPAGITVAEGGLIDNAYDHFWWHADEAAFAKATEYLMTHQMRREELGRRGPVHIARNFRWDAAAAVFADLVSNKVEVAA
jgi:glycosyltransferase involved in cell wall biosynthesis